MERSKHIAGEECIEARLRRAACAIREWNWLGAMSSRRHEAIEALSHEARSLIALMPDHPEHADRIARIVVCQKRLIDGIRSRIDAPPQYGRTIIADDPEILALESIPAQDISPGAAPSPRR